MGCPAGSMRAGLERNSCHKGKGELLRLPFSLRYGCRSALLWRDIGLLLTATGLGVVGGFRRGVEYELETLACHARFGERGRAAEIGVQHGCGDAVLCG